MNVVQQGTLFVENYQTGLCKKILPTYFLTPLFTWQKGKADICQVEKRKRFSSHAAQESCSREEQAYY